jgi:hypothetical protein
MAGSITRGPWTVQPFGHGAEIIGGDGRRVASVCVRYDRDAAGAVFPDVQGAAGNARAIAEVPAMLAIIQQLHSGDTTGPAIDAVLAECRAILGRIEGGR